MMRLWSFSDIHLSIFGFLSSKSRVTDRSGYELVPVNTTQNFSDRTSPVMKMANKSRLARLVVRSIALVSSIHILTNDIGSRE